MCVMGEPNPTNTYVGLLWITLQEYLLGAEMLRPKSKGLLKDQVMGQVNHSRSKEFRN